MISRLMITAFRSCSATRFRKAGLIRLFLSVVHDRINTTSNSRMRKAIAGQISTLLIVSFTSFLQCGRYQVLHYD